MLETRVIGSYSRQGGQARPSKEGAFSQEGSRLRKGRGGECKSTKGAGKVTIVFWEQYKDGGRWGRGVEVRERSTATHRLCAGTLELTASGPSAGV